jgi:hypothetical protein
MEPALFSKTLGSTTQSTDDLTQKNISRIVTTVKILNFTGMVNASEISVK